MSPKLAIHLRESDCRPGDAVRGHAEVVEGGRARRLMAFLHQRDRTPDYSATLRTIDGGTLYEGALVAGASFEFSFEVPRDAVPTCQGGHGELFWEVHLKSDEPGLDTHVRQRVTVLPGLGARGMPASTS